MTPFFESVFIDDGLDDGDENDEKEEAQNDGAENEALRFGGEFLRQLHLTTLEMLLRREGMKDGDDAWGKKENEWRNEWEALNEV